MGCLNDEGKFSHWFGNIHLSGPCNRSCYFCIGQHMMALDPFNNLNKIPDNLDAFLQECGRRRVAEVCLTGTNTDPLLYKHHLELLLKIREAMGAEVLPHGPVALRTNGVSYSEEIFGLYDKASISICSFDKTINNQIMGGDPPNLERILANHPTMDIKINVILCPENIKRDIWHTLDMCAYHGIRRVNLREPYGQPHVGDPLSRVNALKIKETFGMPTYNWGFTEVTYWDVHYVEVESVNLYASGRISVTYPITKGHVDGGVALPQYMFPGGRVHEQWLNY